MAGSGGNRMRPKSFCSTAVASNGRQPAEESAMTHLPKQDFDTAMQDVAKAFGSPAELLAVDHLDRVQKLKLLQQWDYDLGLLLVAGEENMTGDANASPAEKLRMVREAIARLGTDQDSENSSTGKVSAASIPELDTKAARRAS
jgi:hypothetical protein